MTHTCMGVPLSVLTAVATAVHFGQNYAYLTVENERWPKRPVDGPERSKGQN
jgi:hypothetical protein